MNFVIFSSFAISIFLGAEAFFFSSKSDAPVDCVWTTWSSGSCVQKYGKLYRHESREKVKAKNGGRDCFGNTERFLNLCSPQQFVAQNFMKTFSQGAIVGKSSQKSYKNQGGFSRGSVFQSVSNRVASKVQFSQKVLSFKNTVLCSVPFKSLNFQMSGRRCANRRKRDIRTQPRNYYPSSRQVRDVLFLLDQSGSVIEANFKEELVFVKETISKLCNQIEISESKTRVAVASFDTKVHVHMNFDEHFEREDVLKEIGEIKYNRATGWRTCLIKALEYARQSMFTTAHGARVSKDIYNMIVLVTDGCANCDGDLDSALKTELKAFENQDITFMLITIGDKTSCSKKISSFANGNHCFLNYEMDSWDDFRDFVHEIKVAKDCFDRWTVPDATCNE